jgi:hypothetical protein
MIDMQDDRRRRRPARAAWSRRAGDIDPEKLEYCVEKIRRMSSPSAWTCGDAADCLV